MEKSSAQQRTSVRCCYLTESKMRSEINSYIFGGAELIVSELRLDMILPCLDCTLIINTTTLLYWIKWLQSGFCLNVSQILKQAIKLLPQRRVQRNAVIKIVSNREKHKRNATFPLVSCIKGPLSEFAIMVFWCHRFATCVGVVPETLWVNVSQGTS